MKIKSENNNYKSINNFFKKILFIQKCYKLEILFYRCVIFILFFLNVILIKNFFSYGYPFENIILNGYCILIAISVTAICFIYNYFVKIDLKKYVKQADNYLEMSDRLTACYEIIYCKSDWHNWSSAIIYDTADIFINKKKNLIQIFPHKLKKEMVYILILFCLSLFINIISKTNVGEKIRSESYVKYLSIESAGLNRVAEKMETKNDDLRILRAIHKPATVMKYVADTGQGDLKKSKAFIVGLLKEAEKTLKKEIIDRPEDKNMNYTLSRIKKISNTLENHWKSVDLKHKIDESITGESKGDGVGKGLGRVWKSKEDSTIHDTASMRRIVELIEESGVGQKNADSSIGNESKYKDKSIIYDSTTGGGSSDKSKDITNNRSKSVNSNTEILPLINFDGEIIKGAVWMDALPSNRKECVRKYFSFE